MLNLRRTVAYVVLALLVFICLMPFFVLVINSTRSHQEIIRGFSAFPSISAGANFNAIINNPHMTIIRSMWNSIVIAVATVVIGVYFSAMTAFGIHAYEFRLKKAAFIFILVIMMLPTAVSALGFVILVEQLGLRNSFIPLTVPAMASPVVFFFMIQYMKAALPLEIIEAARIDGSNEFMTFNRIVMPLLKPALAVQAIFIFVGTWNSLFMPQLLLDDSSMFTLPILIARLQSADFTTFDLGSIYMMIGLSILPVVIVYLILSKFIVKGVSLGGVKG